MGYGKKGKKGKQALAMQYEDLKSERTVYLAEIIIGAVLVLLSIIASTFCGLSSLVPDDMRYGLIIGAFVVTFIGAILAAFGAIKLSQINPEYKRVKERIGY